MDFLLQPMELGTEFEDLLDPASATITCDSGYACQTGTVKPDK
jgi:hypothetical protein